MSENRFKDRNWVLSAGADGSLTARAVEIAVLMDLRDELKRLNGLLNCPNFTGIPGTLRRIEAGLRKRKPRRRKARP